MSDEAKNEERVKLPELYAKYPREKYISILPNLFTAEELPEHISFGVQVFSLSPDPEDKETYWLDYPLWSCGSGEKTWKKRAKNKPAAAKSDEPLDEGWLGISKVGVQKFDVALGVKWIPEYNRRVDDGRNPDVFGYQAAGMIAGLSGSTVETDQYWLDLSVEAELKEIKVRQYPPDEIQDEHGKWLKWNKLDEETRERLIAFSVRKYILDRRHKAARICMTGARLRVLRNFAGIPQKFRPSVLAKKEFAVLTTIFRPQAHTENERIALQSELASRFLPAYTPAAETKYVPPATEAIQPPVDRPALPASEQNREPLEVEIAEAEIVDDEAENQADLEAEAAAPALGEPVAAKVPPKAAEALESLKTAPEIMFIQEVRRHIEEIAGITDEKTAKAFRDQLLNDYGLSDYSEATEIEKSAILSKLSVKLDEISQPAEKTKKSFYAGKSYASILATREKGLRKKDVAQLKKAVNELITLYKYSMNVDPAGLKKLFNEPEPSKDVLVEAALRVIAHGLEETLNRNRKK